MNFHEYPALVAPTPLRFNSQPPTAFATRSHSARLLSAAVEQFDRAKIADNNGNDDENSPCPSPLTDRDLASPRSSSRASLPSEALEEFLSILRPSFFPPPSPNSMLRARRQATSPYTHERSYSFKARRLDLAHQKSETNLYSLDEIERDRSAQLSRTSPVGNDPTDGEVDTDVFSTDNFTSRWHNSSTLASPVSRMHTRNPFHRHASYDYEVAFHSDPNLLLPPPALSYSPVAGPGQSLSPSAVPLPSPSPDELLAMTVM